MGLRGVVRGKKMRNHSLGPYTSPEQVVATVNNVRKDVMPAWESRLDPATIKARAVYVHGLDGGK